jgi:hypothetical protein
MRALQPAGARALEHVVEGAVGAAVRVGDGHVVVFTRQPHERGFHRRRDALRTVV